MKHDPPHTPGELRHHAEERLKGQRTEDRGRRTELETANLVQEQRARRIELDLQDEELRQARTEIEAGHARYADLYNLAPVGYVTVNEQGLILEANLAAATLLGVNRTMLVRQTLTRFIAKEDQDVYALLLEKFSEPPSTGAGQPVAPRTCELRLVKPEDTVFWARLDATATAGPDDTSAYYVVLNDITERKSVEEALRQSTVELHALAAHLNAVREEERAALSRELHDNLGQSLTALQTDLMWIDHRLQAAEPPDLAALHDKIADMVPLVENLTELTQTIISSLRSGVLDDLGLVAALEWMAEDTTKRTGLRCLTKLPTSDIEVDGPIALTVFRIVQEALANVVRHAQATHVTIRLHSTGNMLDLEIQDNGRGGAPGTFAGHKALGLIGMRERAAACGGTVVIGSKPGKGTTVRVRMPTRSGISEQEAVNSVQ